MHRFPSCHIGARLHENTPWVSRGNGVTTGTPYGLFIVPVGFPVDSRHRNRQAHRRPASPGRAMHGQGRIPRSTRGERSPRGKGGTGVGGGTGGTDTGCVGSAEGVVVIRCPDAGDPKSNRVGGFPCEHRSATGSGSTPAPWG
ncbi:hypothetical protein SCATT_p04140 (plasmid) [Streptantibioticus cattleyicolor NRRL 8057 = DSM 46488]|uniref:Uncharacterized protein n=1 Tax=Streptantibioticus cattleyicolor (strain ATCC 35852 / DSM 46488 / JCM 4925 / NBRC 14057 / NRRL 8057) TaxID=1003195 RepID=G8XFW8_STREN|nr:hypothetical protein SCATT_p04140 [Streptantibioticus cattleyicolor NRRL 8057 = DSM 46488]